MAIRPTVRSPELAVIIPVLNETPTLPALFATLARQEGVVFEVLLSDGGSTDGTRELARRLAAAAPFPCRLIKGAPGRGRQLNAGARQAAATNLLFLHADSTFADPLALRRGLDALTAAVAAGDERIAGRFALRFRDYDPARAWCYYYLEAKARLDRLGCTHGDQGFLLRRSFFEAVGPFDEAAVLMEDTRLAERIRQAGRWLLLPAEITTSARRFETEGFAERYTVNALIMNAAAVGWEAFFRQLPGLYRRQDRSGRLRLYPLLRGVQQLLRSLPAAERRRLWYRSGSYVRGNAWQLAFALDRRRSFRRGRAPGEGETPLLLLCDRWHDRLTDHPPGRLLTALLLWCWFHLTLAVRRREGAATYFSAAKPFQGEE